MADRLPQNKYFLCTVKPGVLCPFLGRCLCVAVGGIHKQQQEEQQHLHLNNSTHTIPSKPLIAFTYTHNRGAVHLEGRRHSYATKSPAIMPPRHPFVRTSTPCAAVVSAEL